MYKQNTLYVVRFVDLSLDFRVTFTSCSTWAFTVVQLLENCVSNILEPSIHWFPVAMSH